MGLKSKVTYSFLPGSMKLKSDQNGIEMDQGKGRFICQHKLKSDQNGIEMFLTGNIQFHLETLKSDQNGIEIYIIVDLREEHFS